MSALPTLALADDFASNVQVDTTPIFTLAGIVLAALGSIWAVRKVIKLMNRS